MSRHLMELFYLLLFCILKIFALCEEFPQNINLSKPTAGHVMHQ